jgi:hypothetical protein
MMSINSMYRTSLKLVFSNPLYLITSVSVFVAMLVFLLYARGLLFFQPYLVFQLPPELTLNFVLIVITSGFMGLVSSMTIYQVLMQKASTKSTSSGVLGSLVGMGTGVCTSCTQIGFAIISILGTTGATALSFMSHYEIPLRVISIALLVLSYFLITKSIVSKCKIM